MLLVFQLWQLGPLVVAQEARQVVVVVLPAAPLPLAEPPEQLPEVGCLSGHVISDQGISTDPEKVKCIADWPVPTSQKQFLGLASYYRHFIKGFALIASPLHALTHKGREWIWTQKCSEAFFGLKKQLSSAPILSFPNIHLQFVVDTDASGEGLGVALSQVVSGCEHVLAYASRVLSSKE